MQGLECWAGEAKATVRYVARAGSSYRFVSVSSARAGLRQEHAEAGRAGSHIFGRVRGRLDTRPCGGVCARGSWAIEGSTLARGRRQRVVERLMQPKARAGDAPQLFTLRSEHATVASVKTIWRVSLWRRLLCAHAHARPPEDARCPHRGKALPRWIMCLSSCDLTSVTLSSCPGDAAPAPSRRPR